MSSTSFVLVPSDGGRPLGRSRCMEPGGDPRHCAQFYEDEAFLIAAATGFLEAGERRGDRLLVVATDDHWRGIASRLGSEGFNPDELRRTGRLAVLEARETLRAFMRGDSPDPELFRKAIGAALPALLGGADDHPPTAVCAYGEMVDLLCQTGNIEAAIQLEELWEQVAAVAPLSRLCAYRMNAFVDAADAIALGSICAAHDRVSPAESYLAHPDPDARAREVVLLQQRARALEGEIANRKQLEVALRDALAEKERIEEALRQSEVDLRRQNDDLARAVRFSEMFVGILGHDLRNPLSAVTTAARLLARRADSDKVARPALRILSSSERMARMIDQLLDFTRIRLGQGIPLQRSRVDLEEICRMAVDELEGDSQAGCGKRVQLQLNGDATGVWDGDRLTQLVSNLVGNALAHGTAGTPAVVRIDGTGPGVVLAVENAGVVPPEILPRLFQPLRSGADKKEARSSGLGLGLYISEQIAIAHGGTIEVASSAADGTRITVRLPRSLPR